MTKTPNQARLCLPVFNWPDRDRRTWQNARQPASDILSMEGSAAHLRSNTVRTMESAYGRWIAFLLSQDDLALDISPGARVTEDHLRAYIEELKTQIASSTLANRIRDLDTMIGYLDPDHDRALLKRIRQKLKRLARPARDKREKMVPPEDLMRLAANLMRRAETDPDLRDDWRASTYRDGMIIFFLLFRPLRRANLAGLIIGETFIENNGGFDIRFPASQMKNNRLYEANVADLLMPPLRRYIDHYRPVLLKGRKNKHLWISAYGTPLNEASIYHNLSRITRAHLSVSISPHRFRDIAVTSLGEENPELVRLGQTLLHHVDPRVTERHYNHARQQHAVKRYQSVIEERRGAASQR